MADGSGLEDLFAPLYEALVETYGGDEVALTMMLKLRLKKSLSLITKPASLDRRIFELVERYEADTSLEALLRAAHGDRPDQPKLRDLYLRRFGAPAPAPPAIVPAGPPPDPFSACEIGDAVFLDRRDLRESLRAIESSGNRPVVVVHGPPRSGRRYTYELIRHIARLNAQSVVWVDMGQPPETGRNPAELVRTILWRMKIYDAPPPHERVNQLLDWTVGQLGQLQVTWWIVLYNFGGSAVSQEVRGFLMGLADQVVAGLSRVRLALLGYDEPILPPYVQQVRLVTTGPIERADLLEFFDGAFRRRGFQVSREVVEKATDEVWTRVPTGAPEHLRVLNELIRDAVDRLFSAGVAP